jgi:quercetin dioxygenase-like cupin family protein
MKTDLETRGFDSLGLIHGLDEELPRRTEKPWGHELLWASTERYAAKIIHIRQGCRLSLQFHRYKVETLMVVSGLMDLQIEEADGSMVHSLLAPGQVVHIPPGRKHRLSAVETCDVLETSTSELEDIVRLQDDFGRA